MTDINSEETAQTELERMEKCLIDRLWLRVKQYEDEEDEGNTDPLSKRIADQRLDRKVLIEVALASVDKNAAIQIVRAKGWWDYTPASRIVDYMVGNACHYSTGLLCFAVVIDHLLIKVLGESAYQDLVC